MRAELVLLGQHVNMLTQTRRRRLVAAVYVGLAALVLAWLAVPEQSATVPLLTLVFVFNYARRLMGGRSQKSDGLLTPFEAGDERERYRRDHAYYSAYKWWDLALIPAFLSTGLRYVRLTGPWEPALHSIFARLPWGLLIAAMMLYYTLPQAILLWTEPDIEAEG